MSSQQNPPVDDWEQAADQTDQNLSQQASRLNISARAAEFRPQASQFVPGQQQFYPQYYPQQQQQMYSQQQYPQYGQPYGQQQYGYDQSQGGYGGGYGAQGGYGSQYSSQQYQAPPQVLQRGQTPPTAQPGIFFSNQLGLIFLLEKPKTSGLPTLPPVRAVNAANAGPAKPSSQGAPKVLKIGGTAPAAKPAEKKEPKPAPAAEKVSQPAERKEEPVAVAAAATTVTEDVKSVETAVKTPSKPPSTQASSRAPSVKDEDISAESRDADSVIKEQEEELDESLVQDMYGKEHVNIVFIGHVDAGKSTLGGNILFLTGMVDERTMEKYEKEAKDVGRESWYLSWALDTNREERAKGKTVEVGRARFETEKRRYTILDAPGHKSYVPNMISGAAQADVGVLVISARKGEFETGFDKGGQTREHAVLAKMNGINKLVVVINKMDDPTVEWSKERYHFSF